MDSSPSDIPRVFSCCFMFNLRCGVFVFGFLEAIFWFFLSILALYKELMFMIKTNLGDWISYIEDDDDWYYYVFYWHPRDRYTELLRTVVIVINLLLALFFIFYFIFTVLLLVGVAKRKKSYFVPYLLFDVFLLLALILIGVIGSFFRLNLSKACIFIFFIKLYSSICVFSLMRDYKGRQKVDNLIAIHTSQSQHLKAIDLDDDADERSPALPRPGLGEAPMAVAV